MEYILIIKSGDFIIDICHQGDFNINFISTALGKPNVTTIDVYTKRGEFEKMTFLFTCKK